jgi:predicted transcriptional regulator
LSKRLPQGVADPQEATAISRKARQRTQVQIAELDSQVAALHIEEGLTQTQVASRLGVSVDAVKQSVGRIRAQVLEPVRQSVAVTIESTVADLQSLLEVAREPAMEGVPVYMKLMLEIIQERSKLLGLYPKESVDQGAIVQLIVALKDGCTLPNPGAEDDDQDSA